MTTQEARKICIATFLESLGIIPNHSRNNGTELWYFSPFRDEKTPSFKVSTKKNFWIDFSNNKGGTVIDFLIHYHNCSVKDALEILDKPVLKNENVTKQIRTTSSTNNQIEIRSIKPLGNPALIKYVRSRSIDMEIAKLYIEEIYYRRESYNVDFFGVCFMNNSEGFEISSKSWKGCIFNKDITFLPIMTSNNVSIFEGFFDFLALLTDRDLTQLKSNVIVLNSNSQVDNAIEFINQKGYRKAFAFLDNDNSGHATYLKFQKSLSAEVIDMRYLYRGFKDYNEYLIEKKK